MGEKKMKENKPLVIVLTRSYSTGLSVIRSVGSAGYTVDLIASAYKKGKMGVAASSKYVRNFAEVVSAKVKEGTDEALIGELLKYAGKNEQKPVLFPTDDYTTSVIDMNRSRLEEHFVMPTIVGGGDGCLTHRMDKTVQAEMAKNAGLLTPLEWIINLEEKIQIPEDMVYPCFCKPIESVTGYKKEMAKCSNRKQLKEHLKKLKKAFPHRSVLVQEFLKIDQEIDLSGVCLDQEIIIPAIIKKWNVAQHERGVTLAGKVVPVEELGDLYEKIVDMLRQRSRPYLFSNTLAPAICAASLKTFDMLTQSTALRDKVHSNTSYFRAKMEEAGFDLLPGYHPIVAVMLYDAKVAAEFADRMLKKGVYVTSFTYPVVPKGKARIRTQVSAGHTLADLDFAVECFKAVKEEMGL